MSTGDDDMTAGTAATAARSAPAGPSMADLIAAMTEAFREAVSPSPPPPPEIVTVGETSDPKIDRLVYCPDCLGRDGAAWGSHKIYWPAADPERPGQIKRMEVLHAHPHVRKAMSYDKRAVTEGLEAGTHGKQCIQCGTPLLAA